MSAPCTGCAGGVNGTVGVMDASGSGDSGTSMTSFCCGERAGVPGVRAASTTGSSVPGLEWLRRWLMSSLTIWSRSGLSGAEPSR